MDTFEYKSLGVFYNYNFFMNCHLIWGNWRVFLPSKMLQTRFLYYELLLWLYCKLLLFCFFPAIWSINYINLFGYHMFFRSTSSSSWYNQVQCQIHVKGLPWHGYSCKLCSNWFCSEDWSICHFSILFLIWHSQGMCH